MPDAKPTSDANPYASGLDHDAAEVASVASPSRRQKFDPRREDPFLVAARREAILTVSLWLISATYSLTIYQLYGNPSPGPDGLLPRPALVFGIPWWVFWGILVPWCVCTAITFVMTTFVMSDGDLGPDMDEDDDAERLLTGKSKEAANA